MRVNLKVGARSSIFRVTTCNAPRTFERLLIKERRKPRFIKGGTRSLIFRVTTCNAPRTKEKVRVTLKGGARSLIFRVQNYNIFPVSAILIY